MARKHVPVHIGFKKLKATLAAKGAANPGGLARYIGEKKYGKAGFSALQHAGRVKAAGNRLGKK